MDGDGLVAAAAVGGDEVVEAVPAAADDDDLGPLREELGGEGQADAGCGADDKGFGVEGGGHFDICMYVCTPGAGFLPGCGRCGGRSSRRVG